MDRMTLLLTVLLVVTPLAGCLAEAPVDAPEDEPGTDAGAVGGRPGPSGDAPKGGAAAEATPAAAPEWRIGQWFGHHVYRKGGAPEGRHYETVVVSADAESWTLATSDAPAAREEAVYDLPVAGTVARGTLATTAFGAPLHLYDFPLFDGKTWTRDVTVRDITTWDTTTYAVRFAADRAAGPHGPAYTIHGTTDNGTLLSFDYVPAIGWYSVLEVYDLSTDEPDDHLFRSESMGHGHDWRGTWYQATATAALDLWHIIVPEPAALQTTPPGSFDAADADRVYGFLLAVAFGGAASATLVAPDQTRHDAQAVHADTSPYAVHHIPLDMAATQGTWHATVTGAGVVAVAGAMLWTLDETAGTL